MVIVLQMALSSIVLLSMEIGVIASIALSLLLLIEIYNFEGRNDAKGGP